MSRTRMIKVRQELVKIPVDKILEEHSVYLYVFTKLNVQPHTHTQKLIKQHSVNK